jgi:copper resistance protein B
MSALRISPLAAAFALFATAAAAQTPAAPDQPQTMAGMEAGAAMQPVMDQPAVAPVELPLHEQELLAHLIFNEFEGRFGGSDFGGSNREFRWEGEGWIGGDYDKLWIKSEGTLQGNGSLEDGQHQFLYDRAITTYFDLQVGLRSDIDSRPTRNWAAFGIQGLAPYFFDLELTGYVSGQGHLAAKLEAFYDLLLTQRLILQPQIEVNLYSKADPARMVGAGFSEIDTGLRLRYEFSRKFAPYLGVAYEGKFGQTANLARRAGESTGSVRFVAGLRLWF